MELAKKVADEAVKEIKNDRSFAWLAIEKAQKDIKLWFTLTIIIVFFWFATISIFVWYIYTYTIPKQIDSTSNINTINN